MTETMIEKVARAIFNSDWPVEPADSAEWEELKPHYMNNARAALQAIREPSDEMLAPACKTHKPGEPMSEVRPEECPAIARRRRTFTAVIDAILEGNA